MNPLDIANAILVHISAISPLALLLFKITLLLAIAWLVHFALARGNPRWRTLLWRGSAVGLVLLAVWTLGLPSLAIAVDAPQPPATALRQVDKPIAVERAPVHVSHAMVARTAVPSSAGRAPTVRQPLVPPAPQSSDRVKSPASPLPWRAILVGIWAFVAAMLVVRLTIGYVTVASLLRASTPVAEPIGIMTGQVAASLRCRRAVQVRCSERFSIPFLYGLWRPVLVLPQRMCEPAYRPQLPGVLAHELAHVRAGDFGWNAILQTASILLWFHPLAWRMAGAHRAACDAVCDAVSASFLGDAKAYCQTLARVALEGAGAFPAAGLAMARVCDVRRRIAVIERKVFGSPLRRRVVFGTALVGLLSLVLLAGVRFALAEPLQASKTREAPAVTARTVLEDVAATYKSLETYKAEGTVTMDMKAAAERKKTRVESSFSIAMQKPNRYLISWTQTNSDEAPRTVQSGAIWSDGTQPYSYMGRSHTYSKMGSDTKAISSMGMSSICSLAPQLFLQGLYQRALLSRLEGPKIEKSERIGDEDCYVISGTGTTAMPTQETLWISKSKHFVVKWSFTIAPPKGWGISELTDKEIEDAVQDQGLAVTEENKKKVREQTIQGMTAMKAMRLSFAFTELYTKVSTPALKAEDFRFVPPKEAVLKDSLFSGPSGQTPPPTSAGKTPPPAPAKAPATEQPPIPLLATVVDVHGTPLAGAKVLPLSRKDNCCIPRDTEDGEFSDETDSQGRFELLDGPDGPLGVGDVAPLKVVTPDGNTYEVNVRAQHETIVHVPTLLNAKVKKVENVGVGELAGVVIDEDGKPIEGVDVDVWDWYPGNETKTDRGGVFRLAGFDRGEKVEVRFRKPGYSPETFIQLPTGVSGWVLVLGKKTFFDGIVRGPDGKPTPHASVRADQGPRCASGGILSNIWTETTTDDAGHFRLYVQPDRYQFSISAPGVGVAQFAVASIDYGSAPLDLHVIKLQPGVTFRAKVVDSQTNKPVEGVRLGNWQYKGLEGRSNADGIVTIAGMFPGDFEFEDVEAKGYTRWWSESAKSPWSRKLIEKSADPRAIDLHWQRNFDGIDFVLRSEMKPVEIVVEKGVRIRGRVVDPDGKPVVGATVAPALTGTGSSLTGDTRFSVTTTKGGKFEMLLPASNDAQYNLMAHDGEYQQWRNWANGVLPPIRTRPGEEIDNVVLTLSRPAVVRGKVVDKKGNPLPYCEVMAQSTDKLENRYYDPTTKTNPDGTFELKFVRAGEQLVQAAPFWGRSEQASKHVTVEAGKVLANVQLITEKPK